MVRILTTLILIFSCIGIAQAQLACTGLTTAGTLTGSECMATDQSGNARRTDPDGILNYVSSSGNIDTILFQSAHNHTATCSTTTEGSIWYNSGTNVFDFCNGSADTALSGISNLVEDTTPQLGGNLDLNGNVITGLVLGTDVQAFGAVLDDFNTLGAAASDGQFIVATGAGAFAYESGATARTSLSVDVAGTDNSTDVTLAGTPDYITISGQIITRGTIDIADLSTGTDGELITWDASANPAVVAVGNSGQVLTSNGIGAAPTFQTAPGGGDMLLAGVQNVTAEKNFDSGTLKLNGATSGKLTINATAIAGTTTLTFPAATDTIVGKATTDTLTNKTFDANGTGNSISNVDVADLANGTDGQLITWDAAAAPATVATGTATYVLTSNGAGAAPTFQVIPTQTESLCFAISDETTDFATGTADITFRMPYAFTLTDIRASVNTAPVGSTIIIDVNEAGTTLMTTNKLSIDASEKTTETAATAPTLTDTSLADDAEITADIDQIGSSTAGKGAKVCLVGTQT